MLNTNTFTATAIALFFTFTIQLNATALLPFKNNLQEKEVLNDPPPTCPLVVDYVINTSDMCLVPSAIGNVFGSVAAPNTFGTMTVDLSYFLQSPNAPLPASAYPYFGLAVAIGDDVFYLKVSPGLENRNEYHLMVADTQTDWGIFSGGCDEWIIRNDRNNTTAAIITPLEVTTPNTLELSVELYSATSCFLYYYPENYTMVACNSQLRGSNPSDQASNATGLAKQFTDNTPNSWTTSNPVLDQLHIQFVHELNDPATLELYTMQGQLMSKTIIPARSAQYHLSVQNLPAGPYVCRITTHLEKRTLIIVKQ
ncbi:T9SS type A sorting domain-containing protein [Lewinella sp. LCG006]|uniref:T9SS type A sorting domain-containing protein n=1 Tax=Lewinella sp. LCG006 TaxID=3231911 RepID=UPI00345FB797